MTKITQALLAALALLGVTLGAAACSLIRSLPTEAPQAGAPWSDPTPARTAARVVYVIDGDTIMVEIGGQERRLRYIGIDAPETVKESTPVEWQGPEASAATKPWSRQDSVPGKRTYQRQTAMGCCCAMSSWPTGLCERRAGAVGLCPSVTFTRLMLNTRICCEASERREMRRAVAADAAVNDGAGHRQILTILDTEGSVLFLRAAGLGIMPQHGV